MNVRKHILTYFPQCVVLFIMIQNGRMVMQGAIAIEPAGAERIYICRADTDWPEWPGHSFTKIMTL